MIFTKKEEIVKSKFPIKNILSLLNIAYNPQESYYFLQWLIDQKFIEPGSIQNIETLYFSHYKSQQKVLFSYKALPSFSKFKENFEELSKNDCELHKKLIREGVNPNEIAKIIRNDDIEKLQEIVSSPNFDFNQVIEPSLYEKFTFINQNNVKLIEYAAFFGSIKCFKLLKLSGSNLENIGKYAIAGGNLEIIHICEQSNISFFDSFEIAVEFHQKEIFYYLYENKIAEIKDINELGKKCIKYNNFEIFSFLEDKGMKVNDTLFMEAASNGNLYLIKHFQKENISE